MQVADISARANNNAKLRRARREFEANVPLPPSDEEKSGDSDVDMDNPEDSPDDDDDDDDCDMYIDDGEQKIGEAPPPPFQFRSNQQAKRRRTAEDKKERRLKQERQQERRRREDRKQSVREAEEQRGKARRVGRIARRIEDRAGRDYDNRKVSAGRRVAGSKRKTPPARYRRNFNDNKRQRGRGLNLASPDEMIDRLSLLFNSQSAGNISDELYNEASQIIDKLNTIGVLSSGEVKKLYKKFLSN